MLSLLAATLFIAVENQPQTVLEGIVHDSAGQPIANASVFVYTAGPRKGVGVL